MTEKRKHKYINDFPIIIIIVVAIISIILGNLYLSFRPYGTVHRDGYMILSNNMTYNLINNTPINDNMNIGVAEVNNGDYLYKQADSYYVGIKEKKEIEMDYPIYSSDGLTIYNSNDNIKLINRNFEILDGYSGLSMNYGVLYNDGDIDPADDIDYILLSLENSIFINTQVMTINTLTNEYTIPMNSPIYFGLKYINYYTFDGKNFNYERISDIYYDSIIRIGNVSLTYEQFLIKLNLIKQKELNIPDNNSTEENTEIDITTDNKNEEKEENIEYIKPSISIDDFIASVYSIKSNITVSDPSGVITQTPTFELYTSDGKLYSRKKVLSSGEFKISGLESNKEYKIVGTYKYKNKNGVSIISTFYEGVITTKDITTLDDINISSEIGDRYSNQIEIKNLKILNQDSEAVSGVKKIDLIISKEKSDSKITYTIPYDKMNKILTGEPTTITSSTNLSSNTVYNYEIKFYDKDDNELKSTGDIKGTISTSKAQPSITFSTNVDKKTNKVKVGINTKNTDNVYIKDYEYGLYTSSGIMVANGELSYTNDSHDELRFDNLDYNQNYVLVINGTYDLEDGNGIKNIDTIKEFSTTTLSDNFVAWYDVDTLSVTYNSISADIYLNSSISALARKDTIVAAYLADENGNDILNEDGSLKYYYEYTNDEYSNLTNFSAYSIKPTFNNLKSNTTYILKLQIKVKQLENDLILEKALSPEIKTREEDAYVKLNYKRIVGDVLDISMSVEDPDNLVGNDQVYVEIYDGKYSSKEIDSNYIYRNAFKVNKDIEITLSGYNSDNYTILVYANPYKGKRVKKYLNIDKTQKSLINIDRSIKAYSEMYEQRYNSIYNDKFNTKIKIKYDFGDSIDDLFLIDCSNELCKNHGQINSNSVDTNKIITIENEKKEIDHTFYVAISKPGSFLNSIDSFYETSMSEDFYILSSLKYNTGYEIYNIDETDDFYNTGIIKTNNETRNYVVTEDLDFGNKITGGRFSNFNGTIDFQGHSVMLYGNTTSIFTLFNSIQKEAILKNAVLNYNLDFDSTITTLPGFVDKNYGTLQDFIINIDQRDQRGRFANVGLLAYENYGALENFAIYLKSDLHVYGYSSFVTRSNRDSGIIRGGYVSTDPNLTQKKKVIVHDSGSVYGTFGRSNYGLIDSVYNLVDVITENPSNSIATIINTNYSSGTIKNVLSVATTTQNSSRKGPTIQSQYGIVQNNYYVDTNVNNLSYSSKYNKKINPSSLRNNGVLEVILNKNDNFSILQGYYPTVKMSSFMDGKQILQRIPYDYKNSGVDIISSEVISSNDNSNKKAKIKLHISNLDKMEITAVSIESLTTEIQDQIYNETTQTTELILGLSASKETDIAKSEYDILKIEYKDYLGGNHYREYSENDRRNIDIDIYRHVTTYGDLIEYINTNQNIYLDSDIIISPNINIDLPNNENYSAVFNGNNKKLDFNKNNISRGYFIYSLSGIIKNLQVEEFNVETNKNYIGFIRLSQDATIDNVDIKDAEIVINTNNSSITDLIVGPLLAYSVNSNINRVSVNNSSICRNKTETQKSIINAHIGGIVGYMGGSRASNSYAYNLNIYDIYNDASITGDKAIGGIVAYINSLSTVENSYSTGKIDTEYSNVGGIAGKNNVSYIKNSYSSINIISTGDYIGGIAGKVSINTDPYNSVANTLYIGKLTNLNNNSHYSQISAIERGNYASNNYALEDEDKYISVEAIDLNNMLIFDNNSAFNKKDADDNIYLPYLIESSFVIQKVQDDKLSLETEDKNYSIEYNNETCEVNDIYNVNNNIKLRSDLYNHACADSAILTLSDGYEIKENSALNIEKNSDGTYTLTPKQYLNRYRIKVSKDGEDEELDLDLSFYRKVESESDWEKISTEYPENVLLLNNIELNSNSITGKKIHNLLGNGYTLSSSENTVLNKELITRISGQLRDVEFSSFEVNLDDNYVGLIKTNQGSIENVKFNKITITSSISYSGIISVSSGSIKTVNLNTIKVSGKNSVGGLVAYNDDSIYRVTRISDVVANNIEVEATSNYAGGIVGNVDYVLSGITADNIKVSGKGYVGGIAGKADVVESTITNGTITGKGSYIGGIAGYRRTAYEKNNLTANDLTINIDNTSTSNYIGGIYGYANSLSNMEVNNLKIYKVNATSNEGEPANANNVGGIGGFIQYLTNAKVYKAIIFANSNVGGISGSGDGTRKACLVDKSTINATGDNVGGISGYVEKLGLIDNLVMNTEISGKENIGGIVGYASNSAETAQDKYFPDNFAIGVSISATKNAGGIIGNLYQVPNYSSVRFRKSLFYGNLDKTTPCDDCDLIGIIQKNDTGSSSGYGTGEISMNDFYQKSDFKEYNLSGGKDYQIKSIDEINTFVINTNYTKVLENIEGKNYFPIFKNVSYPVVPIDSYVEIPTTENTQLAMPKLMMRSMGLRSYASAYNNKVNIDYEVYASDVDKINIDFSDIDSSVSFYYKIGNYTSEYIPITSRTYTILYDFKTPIEIYVTNGSNYKTSRIDPTHLQKTLTLINGKTYYINNDLLYSENSVITGNFVNLYGDKALTSEGKIYNISSKTEQNNYIDYSILSQSEPLYSFKYNDQLINTYYTYSLVNGNIKNYQVFVKNGNVNIMNNTLSNKKDSYIIDYYNNNEIQIVLNENGVLYSLKNNIKYPSNFVNKNISEIYSDIYSNDSVVAIKYNNGYVYAFNYRTGDELFNNESKSTNFFEFVKDKISGTNTNNTIENITSYDKYSEINILKDKIIKTSVEDASNQISDNNSNTSNKKNYVTAYNEITKNYDIYDIEQLFDESNDLDSENDKIYKNYELVQFYNDISKKENKNSLSGIIIFSISIVAIIFSLYLLIKRKKTIGVK